MALILTLETVAVERLSAQDIYASAITDAITQEETDLVEVSDEVQLLIDEGYITTEEAEFYAKYGEYLKGVCERYEGIDYMLVLSMIETESWFTEDIENASNHVGLMQVSRKWSKDRMANLGCTDLLDPYENILVGVDCLAEWLDICNGNLEFALMCYNQGYKSAEASYKKGVSKYARTIMGRVDRLHAAEELLLLAKNSRYANIEGLVRVKQDFLY